ncbi:MAG: GH92 family glycosyl hydrolase [Bacteroidales bacterium]|nr:GH92 family glycosyl hydrolase [Bacteroidales bacterium]
MKKLQFLAGLAGLLLLASACNTNKFDSAAYVNPFIGTDGHGHTFPGASLPNGMVQLSPDSRIYNWDACSGYHFSDSTILGFSHTHLSGTGAIDYGDIRVMPFSGEIFIHPGDENAPETGYRSSFSHTTEKAEPGYYAVRLEEEQIDVELTASYRVGFHKYTYHSTEQAGVIFDLKEDLGKNKVLASSFTQLEENEVAGFRQTEGWADNQHVYFVARFSKPIHAVQVYLNDTLQEGSTACEGNNVKAVLLFTEDTNEPLLMKVGISAVSIEGARANLEAEMQDWDFESVRQAAYDVWNEKLSVVTLDSKNEEAKKVYYTALYHSFLAPNLYSDVDGQYRGMDQQIHTADHPVYTVFSLWDTFRATHPLLTVLDQELAQDLVKTILLKYKESGLLPVWELGACETGCMIGYHSVPVIVDALAKGLKDFDVELAYEAMKKSATQEHLGLADYQKEGYIGSDLEHEAVSKTLEYAYDDWCIALIANYLGKEDECRYYMNRAASYRNVFDKQSGFMRGKKNGAWVEPFDPYEVSGDFTEANAWQYTFFVPQDVEGLMSLMGNEEGFIKSLDGLFKANPDITGRTQPDISGLIGQYAHGNEPSHHMAYLYNYAGAPWKTQEVVHRIMTELYTSKPDGLCGNEDCGQMSSWFNFSALGFYPVSPGTDFYVLGKPMFEKSVLNLGDTKFTIKASNLSNENKYVQSVTLNGENLNRSFIYQHEIMEGGELVFEMTNQPNKEWGNSTESRPRSNLMGEGLSSFNQLHADFVFVPTPTLMKNAMLFSGETKIEIATEPGYTYFYTLDGTIPTNASSAYSAPITIGATTQFHAIATDANGHTSNALAARFICIPAGLSIKVNAEYSHLYAAGGDLAIVDGLRGSNDFRSAWQGFRGQDVEFVVDFGIKRKFNGLGLGCLQDPPIWIMQPSRVEYYLSSNGTDFNLYATVENPDNPRTSKVFIHDYLTPKKAAQARFVKIIARTPGLLPEWHPGKDETGWIFVDELILL